MLTGNARRIQSVLDCLPASCRDIEAAIVVSQEGLAMVSTLETGVEEERIAAITAGLSTMVDRLRRGLNWDRYSTMMISWPLGNLLLKEIGDAAVLAVLTKNNVDWMQVLASCNWALASILDLDSCHEN